MVVTTLARSDADAQADQQRGDELAPQTDKSCLPNQARALSLKGGFTRDPLSTGRAHTRPGLSIGKKKHAYGDPVWRIHVAGYISH